MEFGYLLLLITMGSIDISCYHQSSVNIMRKTKLLIVSLISIFLLIECPAGASRGIKVVADLSHQSGKLGAYRALIIGINDYEDSKIPDLETAVDDARSMAELLGKRYGFQVKLLLNREATKKAIYQELRNLAVSAKPDDSVLIYYAGHGDLDRTYNDGWWIPADATGGDPITYLDNIQVQKSMRSMQARHVLLISDSCYSGTLFGQARSIPQVIDDKYYLNLYNEKSRWGMTSGNKTPVSDQGTGSHSVFAYQLLKELRKNQKPYISTQEIYTRIALIVSNNSEQTPLCRPIRNTGDQGGEFVFVVSSTDLGGEPASEKLGASLSVDVSQGKLYVASGKVKQSWPFAGGSSCCGCRIENYGTLPNDFPRCEVSAVTFYLTGSRADSYYSRIKSGPNRLKLMMGDGQATAISKELPAVKGAPIEHKWLLTFTFTPAVPAEPGMPWRLMDGDNNIYSAVLLHASDHDTPEDRANALPGKYKTSSCQYARVDDIWYTVKFDFVPR